MFRNSYRLKKLSANPAPCWRSLLLLVVLVFMIGIVKQPVLAQVIDPDVSVKTVLETSIPKDICVGEYGFIKVRVVRTLTEKATNWKFQ